MGTVIRRFPNGEALEYDKGAFDSWCVYLIHPTEAPKPLTDMECFSELKQYADSYGNDRVYDDFVSVYEITDKQPEDSALERITQIASSYGKDSLHMDILFSILYMTMISEEQKQYTKLGKRIKRLGVHALLKENKTASEAAEFMKGMNWRDIDNLCKERGF